VLETSGTIYNYTFSVLIDISAIERFISGVMLKIIKVKEIKQDEFIHMEMSSGAKHKVVGKAIDHSLNLGYFVRKDNMYIMILGYYDVIIGLDWLESHDAILKCKNKQLSWIDDEGKR
jgi:hypothetical protein